MKETTFDKDSMNRGHSTTKSGGQVFGIGEDKSPSEIYSKNNSRNAIRP